MEFTEKKLRTLNRQKGVLVETVLDQVELANGRRTFREVVHHAGGVTVLPVEADGTVWCVRQFRYPFGEALLEAPAGKMEPEETPEAAAARELSEETGLAAGRLIDLGKMYPSPGFTDEVLYLYLALDLRQGAAHPDEGELLAVEKLSLDALTEMTMRGEITDAKTALAVLKARVWLAGEKETQA